MPKKTLSQRIQEAKEQDLVITTARIPRDFWGKVRARAFEEKIGTGALIIKALEQYLKGAKS
jgi:hypothetical protein